MNTYLIAYRKDAHGPAWLLSEAADVDEMVRDITRCPLSKTAMRTVVYFEAPDLDAAHQVLQWVMTTNPMVLRLATEIRYKSELHIHKWEEIQSRLPKERLHVQQAQAEDQPRPQALRLLGADPGGRTG